MLLACNAAIHARASGQISWAGGPPVRGSLRLRLLCYPGTLGLAALVSPAVTDSMCLGDPGLLVRCAVSILLSFDFYIILFTATDEKCTRNQSSGCNTALLHILGFAEVREKTRGRMHI